METSSNLVTLCPGKKAVISNTGEIFAAGASGDWESVLTADENIKSVVYGLNKYVAVGEDIISFVLDSTAPILTVTQQSEYTTGNVTITVSVQDESGIAVQAWMKGNAPADPEIIPLIGTKFTGNTFEVTQNGTYTVYVQDLGGLEAVQTIVVTKQDLTPPSAPPYVRHFSCDGNAMYVNWDASHDSGALSHYLVYRGDTLIGTTPAGTQMFIDQTPDTASTYSVAAVDQAGNYSAATASVYLSGIAVDGFRPGITAGQVRQKIMLAADETLEIRDTNGNTLSDADLIGGNTHIIIQSNNIVIEDYVVILYGDTNGNGQYDEEDRNLIKKIVLGTLDTSQNYLYLIGDANNDGKVSLKDASIIGFILAGSLPENTIHQKRLQYLPARLNAFFLSQSPSVEVSVSQNWDTKNTITVNVTDESNAIQNITCTHEDGTAYPIVNNTAEVTKNGIYTVSAVNTYGNETTKTVIVNHIVENKPYGGYEQVFRDISIESKGLNIELNRYYDSLNEQSGMFGKGWLSTYEMTCRDYNDNPDLNLKVVTVPGEAPLLFALENGVYTSGMTRMTLSRNADGSFDLVSPERITYKFNAAGYLISIHDTLENQISISVNAEGKIQSITDSVQRTYTYSYGNNGLVSTVLDPAGRMIEYQYNDHNLLLNVINPLRTVANQYTYDNNGDLTAVIDAFNNRIEGVEYVAANGRVSKYTDETGSTISYTYNDTSLSVTATNVFGEQTTYTYNALMQLISESGSAGTVTTTYHNMYGDINTVTDADGNTMQYIYNTAGNVTSVISTANGVTTTEEYTYNSAGNMLSSKDTEGKRKYYEYNENGNVTKEITPKNGTDIYTSGASTADFYIVTHTYYDTDDEYYESGLVKKTTLSDGSTVQYTYDDYGYIHRERNSKTGSTFYNYDIIGNLLSIEAPDGDETFYRYNLNGDILRIMKNGATQSRTVYDTYGRILQQIGGMEYNASYDKLNGFPAYDAYDNNGNPVEVGTRYYYGNNEKLSYVKMSCYTVNLDSAQSVANVKVNNNVLASYSYSNDTKHLLQQVQYANAQSVTYTYTDSGNIASMRLDNSNTAAFTYTYDETGALSVKTDNINGLQTSYEDDIITVSRINADGTLTQLHKYETAYVSDVEQFMETVGSQVYTTQWFTDKDRFVLNSTAYLDKAYTYNENSSLTGIAVTKNQNGAAASLFSTAYTYDDKGNITAVQNNYGGNTVVYNYTYNGENITKTVRGGVETRYYYDNAEQLTRVDDVAQNKTVMYEYNGASGNITAKKEYALTDFNVIPASAVSVQEFTYGDTAWPDKLTAVDNNAITYDAMGNPLTYDGWTYVWEAGRQLKRMTKNGSVIDYKYDDSGIRLSKTVNNVTTAYTTIDGRITSQSDGTNSLYFRYDRNNELFGVNINGTEYIYLKNMQGDIEGILDMAGSLVVSYAYDAWGRVLSVTGDLADTIGQLNPMRYRGYYLDSETGYYYLQSRYYHPDWCRFINADEPSILPLNYGNTIGANLFAYCENNPKANFDPMGLFSIPRGIISFAIDAVIWSVFSTGASAFAFLTQPVKATARYAGKAIIKAKMLNILRGFTSKLSTAIIKVSKFLVPVIKKAVGWAFQKWAAKLTATKLAATIAGGLLSLTSNKFLDMIASNITVFLSIGGLIAGLWDYYSDKKLNGWIHIC